MKNFFRNSFRIFSVLLMAAFVSCSQDGDGNVVLPPVPVKGTGNYIKVVRSGEPTINYVAFRIGNESTYAEYECTLREDDDFSIYYGNGYIGVDGCTVYSGKVNILTIKDDFIDGKST